VHKSYGHLYVLANSPAIAPLARRSPTARCSGARCAHGLCRGLLQRYGRRHLPPGAAVVESAHGRDRVGGAEGAGLAAARCAARFAPFAEGNFHTPSGKCEFWSQTAMDMGPGSAARLRCAARIRAERAAVGEEISARLHFAAGAQLLNSSFANLPFALKEAGEPYLDIHPADAAARGIADGDRVRIYNQRGAFAVKARVCDRVRQGVVAALSVWWKKLSPDGRNANEVTSQALADMGGAATFYDCLVEIERAGAG